MLYYANTVHLELWLICPNKFLGHCIRDTIDTTVRVNMAQNINLIYFYIFIKLFLLQFRVIKLLVKKKKTL